MKTTEDLVEAYLVRQRWNTENYPNVKIEEDE
jgi:hypothetical protein